MRNPKVGRCASDAPKVDNEERVLELYHKWAKKNKMDGGFIPFCRQDNWAGHVVMDFAKFMMEELNG